MTRATDRRSLLKTALGGAALAAMPALTACGAKAASFATATLADGITLLTGANGLNMTAFSSGDGLVLVDSGAPDTAPGLRGALRALPQGGAVRLVINTHYHLDQTGGNEPLAKAGARILAHARTKTWLSAPIWVPHEMRYLDARAPEALPTETFYTEGQATSGGETIDYGYLVDAHTDSDIYVFFRQANVLAIGDLGSPDRDPVFDWFAGGWLGGRIDAQAKLLTLANDETRIVPAYGPVMSRAELEAEHAMLATLYERVHALFRKGRSAKDFIKEGALDGLPRTFEDPDKLMYDIHKGLWGHQDALSHDIV
jgi:glyoxylase-like metal-dependent hydrolase (beta-lactamase superfamily II)